jgi:hypothetical protein
MTLTMNSAIASLHGLKVELIEVLEDDFVVVDISDEY